MTAAEARVLEKAASGLGLLINPEALNRIGGFLDLIGVWNRTVRLVGNASRRHLLERHVADSLAPARWLPETAALVADIGSGAGFPGVVLAILRPKLDFLLLESRRRKANFLRSVVRELGLERVRVLECRAGEAAVAGIQGVQIAVSRALRLAEFLSEAAILLSPGGVAIAMQSVQQSAKPPPNFVLSEAIEYALPAGRLHRLAKFTRTVC